MHNIGTIALSEPIDGRFQLALPSERAEEIKLHAIVDADQVVGHHADQAERPWMVDLLEKLDANRIEPLRDVGRLAEPVLTGQELKVRGLELYAYAEGHVALFSERLPIVSADRRR